MTGLPSSGHGQVLDRRVPRSSGAGPDRAAVEVRPSWRAGRADLFAAGFAVLVCTVAPLIAAQLDRDWRYRFLDLNVYQSAVRTLGSGADVYNLRFSWAHLPFTYPPFALVALSWLRLLPFQVVGIVVMIGSLGLLAVSCAVMVRAAVPAHIRTAHRALTPLLAVAATTLGVELEPVRATIAFGQVNLALMALVVLDAFVVPVRYRGILSGLATAVKLTPAIFLLYHACTGGWRAASRQLGTAVIVTVATAAVLPRESWQYWTSLVFTNRAGPTVFTSNQSWTGLVDRLIGAGSAATTAVLILDAVTLVTAIAAVRGVVRDGHLVTALGLTAISGLLISPISWSHHWVWAVVLIAGLALENPIRGARAAASGLAVLFWCGPQWRVPYDNGAERHWTYWQSVAGNSYTLAAAVILAASALHHLATHPLARVSDPAAVGGAPMASRP